MSEYKRDRVKARMLDVFAEATEGTTADWGVVERRVDALCDELFGLMEEEFIERLKDTPRHD